MLTVLNKPSAPLCRALGNSRTIYNQALSLSLAQTYKCSSTPSIFKYSSVSPSNFRFFGSGTFDVTSRTNTHNSVTSLNNVQSLQQFHYFSTNPASNTEPLSNSSAFKKELPVRSVGKVYTARKRNLPQSPLKIKFLCALVHHSWVPDALAQLKFSPKHRARDIAKIISVSFHARIKIETITSSSILLLLPLLILLQY